jgi:murein DD-endopeptidase MepM/ murein hydrolase activator NlpD
MRSLLISSALILFGGFAARALDIALPTANDAIFTGKPEQFYMYVNRYDAAGVKSTPWEGGQYGFVRDPRITPQGTIYTRFHWGMDVAPLQRDEKGNPLDPIHAIAAGRVVHASIEARASNYGKYVVIEHLWDGCPYYSLYAHLSEIHVAPGAEVAKGDKIAKMGFTGDGIDRERSHLHLEVALLMNENFETFYDLHFGPTKNRHGNFNGINLRGLDVARLFRESRANPKLTIPEFLAKEEAFFQVSLPGIAKVDLLKRYPWMEERAASAVADPPAAWQISFTQAGIPLRVKRLPEPVAGLRVAVSKPAQQSVSHLTRGLVTGSPLAAALSARGKQMIDLLTHDPATMPVPTIAADSSAGQTHTVRKGETLNGIADKYKVSAAELQAANDITDPKKIQIGQVLVIPQKEPEAGGE